MLPMAATTRQMPVKPPMMYHHWPLEIRPSIQEKNSVPTTASIQETEPSATLMKSTGSGKIRCLLNVCGSRVKNFVKLTKRKSVEIAQTSVEAARIILYISVERFAGLLRWTM